MEREQKMPQSGLHLTDRENIILTAIIKLYVSTAEPVSSNQLCRCFGLNWSPATIRNVMVRLEKLGLLEHPYSSSGKLPSMKAYQYFVERLMTEQLLADEERMQIKTNLIETIQETDQLIKLTAKVLSATSNLMGVTCISTTTNEKLSGIQIIKTENKRLLLVALTASGHSCHQLFDPGEVVNQRIINKVVGIVNEQGRGLKARELALMAKAKWPGLDKSVLLLLRHALLLIRESLEQSVQDDMIFIEGTSNLINQPEFDNILTIRNAVSVIEKPKNLIKSMQSPGIQRGGVRIVIEEDNPCRIIPALSFISNDLELADGRRARFGIIGPRRMAYEKNVPLVQFTVTALTKVVRFD